MKIDKINRIMAMDVRVVIAPQKPSKIGVFEKIWWQT